MSGFVRVQREAVIVTDPGLGALLTRAVATALAAGVRFTDAERVELEAVATAFGGLGGCFSVASAMHAATDERPRDWVSAGEAKARFGVARQSVERARKGGRLRAAQHGARWFYDPDEVEAWLSRNAS